MIELGAREREREIDSLRAAAAMGSLVGETIDLLWCRKMASEKNVVLSTDDLSDLLERLELNVKTHISAEVRSQLSQSAQEVAQLAAQQSAQQLSSEITGLRSAISSDIIQEVMKLFANSKFTQTPTELGAYVKMEAKQLDHLVPKIVSEDMADRVRPPQKWKVLEKSGTRILQKEFVLMLQDVKQNLCKSVITFTGNAQEDGFPLRKLVDFTIHLRGKPPLPCYTTALFSLHSLREPVTQCSSERKYNSKVHVGHAVSRAITVLQGPSRRKVLVGVTNLDNSFLLLSPVCKQVPKEVPKEAKSQWRGIVDTLEGAHSRGVLHRDVRLGNILLAEDSSFALIDWGFACSQGQVLPFHGSLLTASDSILLQYIEDSRAVLFQPKDDLVSLVKSLYLRSQPGFERKLRGLKAGLNLSFDANHVLDEWVKELEMSTHWNAAIVLAENLAYDGLRNWIQDWALNYCL